MLQRFYERHGIIGTVLRIIKFLTTFVIVSTVAGLAALTIFYFYFACDLPNIQRLEDYRPPVVSEVFADDGTKIGEFWTECRFWLPLGAIPKQVINAFIASEDARFYEHQGVDIISIFRAMLQNLKAGRVVEGGSTITQQITRSILLTTERKVARKIREAILATRIERNLNKEQILELYLNQIFLGNRAYGVKAAARNYFHKSPQELTLAETAMIAGLPTAPTSDSPVHSIERARERQHHVLERMYAEGFITKEQIKSAVAEPLTIYTAGTDKDFNYQYAPYFVEHVRRILIEKYGEEVVYKRGLKIYTTADLKLNAAAQKALQNGLERLDRRQGYRGPEGRTKEIKEFAEETDLEEGKFYRAVVTGVEPAEIKVLAGGHEGVIPHSGYKWARSFNTGSAGYDDADYLHDPRTKFKVGDIILVKPLTPPSPQPARQRSNGGRGEGKGEGAEFVLAQKPLVQGALYSMDPYTGEVRAMAGGYDFAESEFNRAVQALRQPGSSFKPYIYAAALDKGYTYYTQIMDEPVVYNPGPNQPPWAPTNYGNKYSGLTTFESNLVHSRNVPTVKIANDIGLHYLTAFVRKLGLTTPIDKYLSMALGSNGVYLSEMVTAYSTFAAGGKRPAPVYIKKVTDSDENILEEYTPAVAKEADAVPLTSKMAERLKDLNTGLAEEAGKYIERDKLILTQEEMRILYGEVIPEGYTITPQTAYLMTTLLASVVDHGTGTRVKALGRPVAGKTGTTNDETDCWFIGYTPTLSAGVWVGFDNIAKIGSLETGGKTAAPIFLEYMKEAVAGTPVAGFDPPKGLRRERVASISGGSAVYFKGYSLLREGLLGERRMIDRAIDFFAEDLEGGPPTPQIPPPGGSHEDDFEY